MSLIALRSSGSVMPNSRRIRVKPSSCTTAEDEDADEADEADEEDEEDEADEEEDDDNEEEPRSTPLGRPRRVQSWNVRLSHAPLVPT